eukprot:1160988-Pelagomonas_calceolata.AAC.3
MGAAAKQAAQAQVGISSAKKGDGMSKMMWGEGAGLKLGKGATCKEGSFSGIVNFNKKQQH